MNRHAAVARDLEGLSVPQRTPGIYISLLSTNELKIGYSEDIATRNKSDGFEGSKILAILPGWRGVEADIHARFRPLRSRAAGEPMFQEAYHLNEELLGFVLSARRLGFTPEQLVRADWRGVSHTVEFSDGQRLALEFTYLHVIEAGQLVPRYVLERTCARCLQPRNSLEFLNSWEVKSLGKRTKSEYVVMNATDVCAVCAPSVFPADVAFAGGQTRIRLGAVVAASGETIQGYDRDFKQWVPLEEFGIRRMAKSQRARGCNDVNTLRLQPSTSRHGRAQGTL